MLFIESRAIKMTTFNSNCIKLSKKQIGCEIKDGVKCKEILHLGTYCNFLLNAKYCVPPNLRLIQ